MNKLSRRTLLRAGPTTLLLPVLEANVAPAFAASAPKTPKRLVWVTMGYGVNAENWFPSEKQVGTDYELPPLLESFADLKPDFSIIQNLTNRFIHNPHAGSTNFLTCVNTKKERGRFNNAISCDQLAAKALGQDTRHTSLAIGSAITNNDGHGGRFGYASWGDDGRPIGTYRKMLDLYAALFGTGGSVEEIKARFERKQSSLDLLLGNAKRLDHQISSGDRDRVDEYFTSIRNIENRLSKARDWVNTPYPKAPFSEPGAGIRGIEEIELAFDLMAAAIQSDSTRVMTYMLPTRNILNALKIRSNPHRMSHQGAGELNPDSTHQKRDRIFAEQVSRFVRKLKETKEYDGSSLLDHSLVAYGSALRQGHAKNNGPMLLAGHGGGGIIQGRNVVYRKNSTPVSNLWLSMLRHVGVEQEKFADSKRVLSEVGFS
jgi:hypothetical protein